MDYLIGNKKRPLAWLAAGMKVSGRDQEETHNREEKVPSPPGNAMNGGWAEGRPLGGGRLRVLVE